MKQFGRYGSHLVRRDLEGGTDDQPGIVRFTAADEIGRKINLFRDGQVI